MPPIDDCNPIQDAKHASESGGMLPPPPRVGDTYREWIAAHEEHEAARRAFKAAEEAEKTARYKRDNLATRLVRALIAAGHPGSGFVTLAGHVVRINGSGHDRYAELVETTAVEV